MNKTPTGKDFRVQMTAAMQQDERELMEQSGCNNRKELLTLAFNALKNELNGRQYDNIEWGNTPLESYNGLSEKDLVEEAQINMSFDTLIQKAILTEAKRLYRANQPVTTQGTKRKQATNTEVLSQIHYLVQERMRLNEQAGDWTEQRFINTSWVQQGGREDEIGRSLGKNLFNFKSVKQYLDLHAHEIEQHHNSLNISENHNRKVIKELKRMAKV
jgi:hypothetical protein